MLLLFPYMCLKAHLANNIHCRNAHDVTYLSNQHHHRDHYNYHHHIIITIITIITINIIILKSLAEEVSLLIILILCITPSAIHTASGAHIMKIASNWMKCICFKLDRVFVEGLT